MPIRGYGVVRGTPAKTLDASDRSPHYQILLKTADQQYRVAVNARSQVEPHEVLYFIDDDFEHDVLTELATAPKGFTAIPSQPGGLALDYVRGRLFDVSRMRPLPLETRKDDNDLNSTLDAVVRRAIGATQAEVFAFGQWFPPPNKPEAKDKAFGFRPEAGIHDIHMNQGNDPADASFFREDGTWQDGGLLLFFPQASRWVAFFTAFQSQSFQTGDDGHKTDESSVREALRSRPRIASVKEMPMAPVNGALVSGAVAAWRGSVGAGDGGATSGGEGSGFKRRAPKAPTPPPRAPLAAAKATNGGDPLEDVEWPPTRPLRAYAFDPSRGRLLGNELEIEVRRRDLLPGPVVLDSHPDAVAVVDYDPGAKTYYQPVDLDQPPILMSNGLRPSESDPRFHQQMVYAVATETIEHFETALGRTIHWRRADHPIDNPGGAADEAIKTLTLFPHAFRSANAFYSPEAHGVLFGYFRADRTDPGRNLPGQPVFTCLSHDIIVHEMTHAIVDGIRAYFLEQTNVDVAAFHEAFADLSALFRHFSHPELLEDTLQRTGGRLFDYQLKPDATTDAGAAPPRRKGEASGPRIMAEISARNPIIELAQQFGEASGLRKGLRSAIGFPPDPAPIKRTTEPHERGSILVAAVFDAFFSTYVARTSDLFRIFRAGGGGANPVDLPGPLARQLSAVATQTAEQFFRLCARSLDYLPPVDVTFGDFLQAVITAHWDLDEADAEGVRDAWMQAFRLRGIHAESARFFSESALRWPTGEDLELPDIEELEFGDSNAFTKEQKDAIGPRLRNYAARRDVLLRLGLDPSMPAHVPSFHPVSRTHRDGSLRTEMVVELVQTLPAHGAFAGHAALGSPFRQGATLMFQHQRDAKGRGRAKVRYAIVKPGLSLRDGKGRLERQRAFTERMGLYAPPGGNPLKIDFALLHGGMA